MNDTTEMIPLEAIDVAPKRAKRSTPAVSDDTPVVDLDLRERVKKLRIDTSGAGNGAKGSFLGSVAWLPWLLCAALALSWAGIAMRTYRNVGNGAGNLDTGGAPVANSGESSSQQNSSSGSPKPAVVPGTAKLVLKGYLIASRQITVSPIDVGGKVVKLMGPSKGGLPFGEGALYEKGDVIAVIDSVSYDAARDEAKANLVAAEKATIAAQQRQKEQMPEAVRPIEFEQLQAEIDETKASLTRATQEYARLDSLRSGGGSISAKEYQQAVADKVTAKSRLDKLDATMAILKMGPRPAKLAAMEADVAQARANEEVAKARLAQAEWRVQNCTIRAPITGTVLTKKAEVGNLVNPMAFNGGGGVCDLADLADLEVDVEVGEKDISKLKTGQRCRIITDAFPDKSYEGKLDRIMPIANRSNSTINVRVKAVLPPGEVPGTYLKPQMGATVSFLAE